MGVCEIRPGDGDQAEHTRIRKLASVREPVRVLNGLFSLLREESEKWIILIQYGEHLAPPLQSPAGSSHEEVQTTEILHQIAVDEEIARKNSRVVLITFDIAPAELLARSPAFRTIAVGLPSIEEREAFISFLEGRRQAGAEEFGGLEEDISTQELARITAGLPLVEIDGLYRTAGHFKRTVCRESVRQTKARAIRQLARDLLQVSEPQVGFPDVAGLNTIKEYFSTLLMPQIRAGRPAPQAILLHGVPGCGKSHVVQALAGELGWPLLEMRNVRGPFVGQSEQQLERVITIVEQLSPCVLFFDEIDQLLGQRNTGQSGDSGTSERLLARIFNWLGSMHLRGRVLFIGASNRPDLLDPALLDRFRVSIPILRPQPGEVAELVTILLTRFGRNLAGGADKKNIANILAALRPNGRSLQEIIIQAGLRADADCSKIGSAITEKHIRAAAEDHLTAEDPTELEYIRLTSLGLCSAQSLLPWNGINGLRNVAEIPDDLLENNIVGKDGRMSPQTLNEHLRSLSQERQTARWMK